jgi:hypothetical protein
MSKEAFDPLHNPIVPRRSFLFKRQIIRFTGILTDYKILPLETQKKFIGGTAS